MENNFDLMEVPELAKNSRGGTETAMERLYDGNVPRYLLEQFQIIPTRMRELKEDKYRILWVHDLPEDPEVQQLANDGWRKFHKIAFVSNWQMQKFIDAFKIPWSKCIVMQSGIHPIKEFSGDRKEDGKINILYHTTPHRGLGLLLPVFDHLSKTYPDIHLNVFSSFKLYGWEQRDEQFKPLFDFAKEHPKITYHEMASDHSVIQNAIENSDIFAYPSIWPETSCLCLIEAMSAGLLCVHSNYGVLFETASNWTAMYPYHEDPQTHARVFCSVLEHAIQNLRSPEVRARRESQRAYMNAFYSWELRSKHWEALLQQIINENPKKEFPGEQFVYNF